SPAREHERPAIAEPQRCAGEDRQLVFSLAWSGDRQLVLAAGARSLAQLREWADQATRRGGGTQRRTKLHEPLVEVTGCGALRQRVDELGRAGPERALARGRLDGMRDREYACEHTGDVAVDERCTLAERDRSDRARGIGPDPRNRAQLA